MKDKLTTVREKIIESVPSIVELKFGCQGKYKGNIYTLLAKKRSQRTGDYLILWSDTAVGAPNITPKYFKILGRKIGLADALAGVVRKQEKSEKNNHSVSRNIDKKILIFLSYWDLANDDLEKQSPETISFLYDLLA